MYSIEIVLTTGLCTLIAGLALGYIIAKKIAPSQEKQNQLEDQLEKMNVQHQEYQQEVNEHFSETAQLVNKMTSSYKDVHNHLAKGAQLLTAEHSNTPLLSLNDETSTMNEQQLQNDLEQDQLKSSPSDLSNKVVDEDLPDKEHLDTPGNDETKIDPNNTPPESSESMESGNSIADISTDDAVLQVEPKTDIPQSP